MHDSSRPSSLLPKVTEVLLLLGLIFAPLAVVPIFTNFLITSKLLLLFGTAIILGCIFIWKTIKDRSIEVPHSSLVLALTLLGFVALISSVLTTQYPMENLIGNGGMFIALIVIAITGGQFLRTRNEMVFLNVLNISGALVAISTVAQQFGFGPSRLLNLLLALNIPDGPGFNLAGNVWVAVQVLAVILLANLVYFIVKRKANIVQGITLPLMLIGLGFGIWAVMPGQANSPVFIPFTLSWSIAIDSLRTPRVALIGLGPENYSDAFQMFKPAWVNATAFWNSNLGQASNMPLFLIPTMGLMGLAAWAFLAVKILAQVPAMIRRQPALITVAVAILVLQILTTSTLVLAWIQAIALAYIIASREEGKPLVIHLFKITYLDPQTHQGNKPLATFLSWGLPLVVAGLVAVLLLWPLGQAYAASHFFFRSLIAQQNNDLNGMYTNQQRAAQLNRYISGYRSNFAMTSLLGARALASDEATAQANQNQIAALIQQAINEGRAAAALRPLDSQAWYVLAQVYGSIVGTTPDALEWAVQAYSQAIQANPTNPLLRLELGTLLFGQERYEDAAVLFQQAYELKPDLTSASYSLAVTLAELGQYEKAQAAYQAALNTVQPGTEEYNMIKAELDALPQAAQGSNADSAVLGQDDVTPSTTQQNVTPAQNTVQDVPQVEAPAASPIVSPEPSPAL